MMIKYVFELFAYHLNKLRGGGYAGGFAARISPILLYLLRRYLFASILSEGVDLCDEH